VNPQSGAFSPPSGGRPVAALTVDVEDWYQSSIDFDAPISDRVVRNVDSLLALLAESRVKATFFVQGMVAEAFPALVARMAAEGHEVQSHGHTHRPLYAMNREQLRAELTRARDTIEDACGHRVSAFRAPDFSIVRENLWALEVLAELGIEVDSSIFPFRTRRYGIRGWNLGPSRVELQGGASILEVPVAVWSLAGVRLPVGGGGYFRVLPRPLVQRALSRVVAGGRPPIVYCHPYELNAEELDDYRGTVSSRVRFAQGLRRESFGKRLQELVSALPYGRLDDVLAAWRFA
jgi:polysaccharide deacetylase family protein (PEP-CTERM system associated)